MIHELPVIDKISATFVRKRTSRKRHFKIITTFRCRQKQKQQKKSVRWFRLIEIRVDTERTWRRFITSFRCRMIINLFSSFNWLPTAISGHSYRSIEFTSYAIIQFRLAHIISFLALTFDAFFRVNSSCALFLRTSMARPIFVLFFWWNDRSTETTQTDDELH